MEQDASAFRHRDTCDEIGIEAGLIRGGARITQTWHRDRSARGLPLVDLLESLERPQNPDVRHLGVHHRGAGVLND